jgi:hypothetical protein
VEDGDDAEDEEDEDGDDDEDIDQGASTDTEIDDFALETAMLELLLAEPNDEDTPMWYVRTFVSVLFIT